MSGQFARSTTTLTGTIATSVVRPACELCHTLNDTVTSDALATGAEWVCTRCGQGWNAERLATVAAYARFESARQLSV